jgi:type VI secretion system protein ImpC
MPKPIQFDVSFKKPGQSERGRNPRQFRLLVMGDFSGHRSIVRTPAGCHALRVDCDNLEQRMREISPALDLSFQDRPASSLHIEFSRIEDFHPDNLYDRVECFNELRTLRKNLLNPDTFAEAARSITGEEAASPSRSEPPATAGSDTFADLLGKPVIQDRRAVQPHPAVAGLIRKFVAPHVVQEPGPEQDRLVESADKAMSAQMREILHHPDFQALESAWKSLDFLVRELELDDALSIHLLDLSKSRWTSELPGSGLPEDSALYETLVTEAGGTPGTEPWNLMVGLYNFTPSEIGLLSSIAELARRAATTFMTGISYPGVLAEPDQDWESLRKSPGAANLCLATPGLLLRLPYGASTDEIDRFEFEEMPEGPAHEHYLWGSAALVCAALIAQSTGREDIRPGSLTRLDGLPVHSYRVQGEYQMTPCGGAWLSESEAERLIRKGVVPVLSVKNTDAVTIIGFQSLAGGPVWV